MVSIMPSRQVEPRQAWLREFCVWKVVRYPLDDSKNECYICLNNHASLFAVLHFTLLSLAFWMECEENEHHTKHLFGLEQMTARIAPVVLL